MGGVRLDDKGSVDPVLLDPTQGEIIGVSASAAERVVGALESVGEVRKAQVQHAGFVVLKSPDIPSMLVETAYISNPEEERHLRTASQQARLAEAIAGGVRSYFLQNPPDGTRFKQQRRGKVVNMVLRTALSQVAIGLCIGVPLAIFSGRYLAHQLYGVGSFNPIAVGGAIFVLTLCAFIAGLIPARRAASIDPMNALRYE
jgi:hypothetical protein